MENWDLLLVEEAVIGLFLVAVLVGILARKLRMPYTLGLVLIGLGLALLIQVEVPITEELILALLVPPLVFEAAFHLRAEDLLHDALPIALLAVPGVVLTMLIVGGVVHYGTGLDLGPAMLFGALVAATDPIAVVALFRVLGAPKRLQVLLEGESLFNDGTAIVVFHLVLGILATGTFSLAASITDFVRVAGGGFLVGLALGGMASAIIARVDDHLVETALTVVLAYGAYLVGEQLHVSGVLAVVAAGIVNGNIGPRGMKPTTRIVVANFWEFAAFVANSFVFLLIGLQVDIPAIAQHFPEIFWAILAVLVARGVDVYGLTWVGPTIPWAWRHVLFWGGLRGAISLALALGIPSFLGPVRDQLRIMAFGVVLFTLLAQGSTIGMLLRFLGLGQRDPIEEEYQAHRARAVVTRAALEHLEQQYRQGLISQDTYQALLHLLQSRLHELQHVLRELQRRYPRLRMEELQDARAEVLRIQRIMLQDLFQAGLIGEEVYEALLGEIDAALEEEVPFWPTLALRRAPDEPPIRYVTFAVIHAKDQHNAFAALNRLALPFVAFPSVGGYLQRRNMTLLIGLPEGQFEEMVEALRHACRRRVEFVALPQKVKGIPIPLWVRPRPVTVGGAVLFLLPVEHYEEV